MVRWVDSISIMDVEDTFEDSIKAKEMVENVIGLINLTIWINVFVSETVVHVLVCINVDMVSVVHVLDFRSNLGNVANYPINVLKDIYVDKKEKGLQTDVYWIIDGRLTYEVVDENRVDNVL